MHKYLTREQQKFGPSAFTSHFYILAFIFTLIYGSAPANSEEPAPGDREFFDQLVNLSEIIDLSAQSMQIELHCLRNEPDAHEDIARINASLSSMNAIDAEINVTEALKKFPQSLQLRLLQATAFTELYQFSNAKSAIEKLALECPESDALRYYQAKILYRFDRLPEARDRVLEISNKSNYHPYAVILEAAILLASAESERALARLETLRSLPAANSNFFASVKIAALTERGRTDEAQAIYKAYWAHSQPSQKIPANNDTGTSGAENYIQAINTALTTNSYAVARRKAKRFIVEFPKLPLAHVAALDVAIRTGDSRLAKSSLESLKRLAPEYPRLNLIEGIIARAQFQHADAINFYRLQQKITPAHRVAYDMEFDTLIEYGDHRGLLRRYEEIAPILPHDYFLTVRKAKALREIGMKSESLEWYKKAIQLAPDRELAYCGAAVTYNLVSRYDEAEQHYRLCLERDSRNTEALSGLAAAARRRGNLSEALALAQRVLAIAPTSVLGNIEYAVANAKLGNHKLAYKTCNSLANNASLSYLQRLDISSCFEQIGELNRALQNMADLHAQRPTPISFQMLGQLYIESHDFDNASKTFQQWINFDGSDLSARRWYGLLLYEMHNYQEAANQFRMITSADPKNIEAWTQLGVCLHEAKDTPERIAVYKAIIALQPDDIEATRVLAALFYGAGKVDDAKIWFTKLESLGADDSVSLYNLAIFYASEKNFPKALAYVEKGLNKNAFDAPLLEQAITIANATGDRSKQIHHLETLCFSDAVTLERSKKVPYLDMLGRIYVDSSQLPDAVRVFEYEAKLAPSTQLAHNNLGYTYFLMDKLENSLREYNVALAQQGSLTGLIYFNQAKSLDKLGQREEAMQSFEMAKRNGYPGTSAQ